MIRAKYIKIDGVSINREWASKLTKTQFINHPQVIELFYRVKEKDRSAALSVIYESVTGKKSKSSSNAPAPVVETKEDTPADPNQNVVSEIEKGE